MSTIARPRSCLRAPVSRGTGCRAAARSVSVRMSVDDTRSGQFRRYRRSAADSGSGQQSLTNAEVSRYAYLPFVCTKLCEDFGTQALTGRQWRWLVIEQVDSGLWLSYAALRQ